MKIHKRIHKAGYSADKYLAVSTFVNTQSYAELVSENWVGVLIFGWGSIYSTNSGSYSTHTFGLRITLDMLIINLI